MSISSSVGLSFHQPVTVTGSAKIGEIVGESGGRKIFYVTNSLDAMESACRRNVMNLRISFSFLENLNRIAKHCDKDINIRLKNGRFKEGNAGTLKNFFNGRRYEMERQCAAKKFGVKENNISVSTAISKLESSIELQRERHESLCRTRDQMKAHAVISGRL